ncbi:Rho termination factor N-terminal domain-containing protein [Actinomadura hibisca]|uniref:Rho termination factor N-terminal domain-containing protein n=1 Tax=Actinomadura hibisca TaxID=68565 RepID=UPI000829ED3C|nr:Rho termination factor N-terminal domain-containing protein [Actinomadura hibisca]
MPGLRDLPSALKKPTGGKKRTVWSGVQSRVTKLTNKVRPSRRDPSEEEQEATGPDTASDSASAPDARPAKPAKPSKAEKAEGKTEKAEAKTEKAEKKPVAAAKSAGKSTGKSAPKKPAAASGSGKRQAGKSLTAKADKKTLYRRAQELDIPGRSKMSKQELVEAIRRAGER